MGPAAIRARDLHVGNSAFKAWADVRWTGAEPPVPAGDFNAYVWIGIDGPDSTVEIGGVTVIREPILAYGPDPGAFTSDLLGWRPLVHTQAIPQDDTLAGATLLWQFLIEEPGGRIVVSDVVGAIVRGGQVNASAGAATRRSVDRDAVKRVLRSAAPAGWDPTVAPAAVRAVLSQLARQ